jgi:hypothetical protein
MTDDLTTFCHHVVWYHDPLTLYAHLNGREVVYCPNDGQSLPQDATNVVYVHADCLGVMDEKWWLDGICVDRPSLPVTYAHKCAVCDKDVDENYHLELPRR